LGVTRHELTSLNEAIPSADALRRVRQNVEQRPRRLIPNAGEVATNGNVKEKLKALTNRSCWILRNKGKYFAKYS
jgi:hypothetical protein